MCGRAGAMSRWIGQVRGHLRAVRWASQSSRREQRVPEVVALKGDSWRLEDRDLGRVATPGDLWRPGYRGGMPTAMLIHAHPDDEVFANFGWAHHVASQGYEVLGVVATGGEASELHATASLEEARARRIEKYEQALAMLGARSWRWLDASAGWIDAPSGRSLSEAAPDRLRLAVERVLMEHRPDIVLTVGSDGLTGHPDHVAIARAVATATNRETVPEGIWGARLRADDVRAGALLVGSHTRGQKVGSGRVLGTAAHLVARDARSSVAARRRALDVYREGLGTDSLRSIVRAADRIGDSVLLRGVLDATDWRWEYYEAVSRDHSGVAARHGVAW